MNDLIETKWKRPASTDYPRIWRTFTAKDVDSDSLVEYRIQDLPAERFDEAVNLMKICYMRDEPTCEAYGLSNNEQAKEDHALLWTSLLRQKVALVCFKEGSDKIVGLNMNLVLQNGDRFMKEWYNQMKCDTSKTLIDIFLMLYKNFDAKTYYNVDSYLATFGLVVDEKYRGRGIGEQFLRARKPFCEAFGIKLSSTIFTSNFSNKIADKVGFELNVQMSYEDIRRDYPEFKLPVVKSDNITIKSIQY